MATVLRHTKANGYAWCECCGDLNVSARGEYLRRLRRKAKRRERQEWRRESKESGN
jgi:hypothetical protein